jgi:hypothetical protein
MRDVHSQILRMAGLESAGLFWISAELAILFMMIAARRHVQTRPLPPRLEFQNGEKRRAVAWGLGFFLLAALVLGRHVAYALETLPHDAAPVLIGRARVHMAVWSGFVTAWVCLEVAIVYQGLRGYLALKSLMEPAAGIIRPGRPGAAILCLAGVFLLHAAAPAQTLLAEVRIANQVYSNAMYLYLRLAGVVWILAEWAAAMILWRAYALIGPIAHRPESTHA